MQPNLPLLNDYQQRFPFCRRPFAAIGAAQGLDEWTVLTAYRGWQAAGIVSRIGPVFAPNRIGVSVLVALAVPPARLDTVAAQVSACPEVNHNYQREDAWNLWFVATAPDAAHLTRLLDRLAADTDCPMLRLPLQRAFHIDLGFDLARVSDAATVAADPGSVADRRPASLAAAPAGGENLPFSAVDRKIVGLLQHGLPLIEQPYAVLADAAGITETALWQRLDDWLGDGRLKRFGVVVRHHELGFRANAMCVWNVPDDQVDELGVRLAQFPDVSLCYRRQRQLPDWPFNLFCMIHGRERVAVEAQRAALAAALGLDAYPHRMLFSCRRFKQQGALYSLPQPGEVAHA